MQTLEDIKTQLKQQIVQDLNLEGMNPEDIQDNTPLFAEGLGLDSIDALELVIIMEKYHHVRVPNEQIGREILKDVQTMAEYIVANRLPEE